MAPEPNLASLQKQWAADDAGRYLARCAELQSEIAEEHAAYLHGGKALETATAARDELVREHDRQAQAAEGALARLREIGPSVGGSLTTQQLEETAREVGAGLAQLNIEWHHLAQPTEGAEA